MGEGGVERRVGGACSTATPRRRTRRWRTSRRRRTGTGRAPSASSRWPIELDPCIRDGAPLVRDVLSRADGPPRRRARRDAARAVARSGVVNRRARPRRRARLPSRLRGGAGAVRSHHRAEPALLPCVLGARRSSRSSGRISTKRSPRSSAPSICRRRARACTAALGRTLALSGKRKLALDRAAQARRDRQAALRVAVRVRVDPVRAGPDRSRLPVAEARRARIARST